MLDPEKLEAFKEWWGDQPRGLEKINEMEYIFVKE